jgi:hypothetical protein
MAEASLNGDARAVVLVEGVSDRAALEVLADRRGMDLAAAGIEIVPMAGITNIGHYLDLYRAAGRDVRVAGLYDDGEERFVRRALSRIGRRYGESEQREWPQLPEKTEEQLERPQQPDQPEEPQQQEQPEEHPEQLERLGFYACSPDLEDELIRALGPSAVEELVAACGELRSFRRLQRQPAQRTRSLHDQLRRLMSGRSGGKERYAAMMAAAVPLDRVPRPLDAVLTHVHAFTQPSDISPRPGGTPGNTGNTEGPRRNRKDTDRQ